MNDNCRFNQYIKETAEHKFQLSPPGLGPDCYRVWESLLVGTIPIVEHSYFDWMYEGLPVLFIDKWEEVTPEFLEQKYREFHSEMEYGEIVYGILVRSDTERARASYALQMSKLVTHCVLKSQKALEKNNGEHHV